MKKNANQLKVLVFGTFDEIHKGHTFFLKEASKLGDLYISIATDIVTKILKGHLPVHDEKKRQIEVEKLEIAKEVLIGETEIHSWKTIKMIKPDIVALGYDQKKIKDSLPLLAKELGFKIKIIKSLGPKKYHSSILRNKIAIKK